jgi:hypothetical protein
MIQIKGLTKVMVQKTESLYNIVLTHKQNERNWKIEFSYAARYDVAGVGLFTRKHRRSPSHFNLKYGRENSPPESPVKEQRPPMPEPLDNKEGCEVSVMGQI